MLAFWTFQKAVASAHRPEIERLVMMKRREFLKGTALFATGQVTAAALARTSLVHAQENWPQRQVTIVVPFSAGGSADLVARIVAQHLQTKFNIPFIVENRGGGGGSIAAAYVAKAPNDGYTLFIGTVSTNAIGPYLHAKLPFDAERDFQPISLLVQFPNLLFVNPKIPAKTVPELIDYLKANDGKANYGSSGNGTSSHMCAVLFQIATGTKMTHVPFRSTSEELNNMIGGHIDLAFDSMTTAWPHAVSGAVRAIAVTTSRRSSAAPDVPTIGETVKGFEATGWQGLFAPAGMPRPIADRISEEVRRILESPEVSAALKKVGADPSPMTPDQFSEFTRVERAKWREVVKASGIRND
jgi:tripartite-type tricarboxylate transporter receptor subunit TctC